MSETGSAKSSTVPEIFDHLIARGPIAALRDVSGVYEFDFEDGARWFLRLDHGAPALQEATAQPDCEVHCSAGDFVEIAQGERNLFTTLLQGRLTMAGDPALAMDVRWLLGEAA